MQYLAWKNPSGVAMSAGGSCDLCAQNPKGKGAGPTSAVLEINWQLTGRLTPC